MKKKTTKNATVNTKFKTDLIRLKTKSLCTWNRFQRMTEDEKKLYLQEILKYDDKEINEMIYSWKLTPVRFNQQLEIYGVEGRKIKEVKKELRTTVDAEGFVQKVEPVEVLVDTENATAKEPISATATIPVINEKGYPDPISITEFVALSEADREATIKNILKSTPSNKLRRELLTGITNYSWMLISNIYGNIYLPKKVKKNLVISKIEKTEDFIERQRLLSSFYKSCDCNIKNFAKKLHITESTATNFVSLYGLSMTDGTCKDIESILAKILLNSKAKTEATEKTPQEETEKVTESPTEKVEETTKETTEETPQETENTTTEEVADINEEVERILPKIIAKLQETAEQMLENEIQEKIIKLRKLGKNEEAVFISIKRICSKKYVSWFRNHKILFCCNEEKDSITGRRKLFNQASFEEGMSFVLVNTKVGYVPTTTNSLEEAAITDDNTTEDTGLLSKIKIPKEVLDAVAVSSNEEPTAETEDMTEEVAESPEAMNAEGKVHTTEKVVEQTVTEEGFKINNIDMSVSITSKEGLAEWSKKMTELIDCVGKVNINVVTSIEIQ